MPLLDIKVSAWCALSVTRIMGPILPDILNPEIRFFFYLFKWGEGVRVLPAKMVLQPPLQSKIQWPPYLNFRVPSSVACWFTPSGTIWLLHVGKTAIIKKIPPHRKTLNKSPTAQYQPFVDKNCSYQWYRRPRYHVTSNNCFVTLTVIVNYTSGIDVKWYRLYRLSFVLAFCIF